MIEKEELEGVFMALCDQRNDEQCLEVLRRWKAQILKETLTKIKIEGSWRGFMREYVKAGGKLSEKNKEICEHCGKPIDEHKFNPSYIKKLKKIMKEKPTWFKTYYGYFQFPTKEDMKILMKTPNNPPTNNKESKTKQARPRASPPAKRRQTNGRLFGVEKVN